MSKVIKKSEEEIYQEFCNNCFYLGTLDSEGIYIRAEPVDAEKEYDPKNNIFMNYLGRYITENKEEIEENMHDRLSLEILLLEEKILDFNLLPQDFNYNITFYKIENLENIIVNYNMNIERILIAECDEKIISKIIYGMAHIKTLKNIVIMMEKEELDLSILQLREFENYVKEIKPTQNLEGFFSIGKNVSIMMNEKSVEELKQEDDEYFFYGYKKDAYFDVNLPEERNHYFLKNLSKCFVQHTEKYEVNFCFCSGKSLKKCFNFTHYEDVYSPLETRYFYSEIDKITENEESLLDSLDDFEF